MECFICKNEIDQTKSISETSFIKSPNGNMVYVHNYHNGVKEEARRQFEQSKA